MKKLLKKIILFLTEYNENCMDACQYTFYHGMH